MFPYNLLKYMIECRENAAVDNAFALTKNDDSALNRENIVNHLCICRWASGCFSCAGAFHREVKTVGVREDPRAACETMRLTRNPERPIAIGSGSGAGANKMVNAVLTISSKNYSSGRCALAALQDRRAEIR